jgi:hypothetical protein
MQISKFKLSEGIKKIQSDGWGWRSLGWLTLMPVLALSLCSCALNSPPVILGAVGPGPKARSYGNEGMLQVFTSTVEFNDGGVRYYPHTAYRIYSEKGDFIKYVRNHTAGWDQRAEVVNLPAGSYLVKATSEGLGAVRVPVVVKGSQLTAVYLDRTPMREVKGEDESQFVRFPGGKIVGWRAELTDAK